MIYIFCCHGDGPGSILQLSGNISLVSLLCFLVSHGQKWSIALWRWGWLHSADGHMVFSEGSGWWTGDKLVTTTCQPSLKLHDWTHLPVLCLDFPSPCSKTMLKPPFLTMIWHGMCFCKKKARNNSQIGGNGSISPDKMCFSKETTTNYHDFWLIAITL